MVKTEKRTRRKSSRSAIEKKTPWVAELVCQSWRKDGCKQSLSKLLLDESSDRLGFPDDVKAELQMLFQLLDIQDVQGIPERKKEDQSAIEFKFPRIAEKVCVFWGKHEECSQFLNKLIMDDRGNRQGFPQDVSAELFFLFDLLDEQSKPDFFVQGKADVWGKPDLQLSAIEKNFPRIAESLCMLWGFEECRQYLNKLILNDRGNRQGFPPDVTAELFMLFRMLDLKDDGDIWARANVFRR